MSNSVILGAARTAVGTANMGTLANIPAEELAVAVLEETALWSGLDRSDSM